MRNAPPIWAFSRIFPKHLAVGDLDLTANKYKTLTFKNAAGKQTRAEELFVFLKDADPTEVKVVYMEDNANADADSFPSNANSHVITITKSMKSFSFFTTFSNVEVVVWAFGTEDISGTTLAEAP